MRDSATIKTEIEQKKGEMNRLATQIKGLREEWNEARVAEAEKKGHPLLGKAVRRKVRHRCSFKAENGTVTIYDLRKHRGIRGDWFLNSGDFFVISKSGLSAYRMEERDGPAWELAE